MELKYKPFVGGVMLAIGLANLVLALLGGGALSVFLGLLLTLLGVLMLTRPIVILSPRSIAMHNPLGMELKRHQLTEDNYEVRKNKIYVDGKRRVSLGMLNTNEQAVREYLDRGASR